MTQVVERPLRERELTGSLVKGVKILNGTRGYQWPPCLALSIIKQALAFLSLKSHKDLRSLISVFLVNCLDKPIH